MKERRKNGHQIYRKVDSQSTQAYEEGAEMKTKSGQLMDMVCIPLDRLEERNEDEIQCRSKR
jgi:hypothetical protein